MAATLFTPNTVITSRHVALSSEQMQPAKTMPRRSRVSPKRPAKGESKNIGRNSARPANPIASGRSVMRYTCHAIAVDIAWLAMNVHSRVLRKRTTGVGSDHTFAS